MATAAVNASIRASTGASSTTWLRLVEINPISSAVPHRANNTPSAAPQMDSSKLSLRSWRTSRERPAPRAMRTANSRCRAAPRARSRFATLAQAISNTRPTTTINMRSD